MTSIPTRFNRQAWTLGWFAAIFSAFWFVSLITPSFAENNKCDSPNDFLNNGVTAHRGFSGRYPENTLLAFRKAMDAEADWLECDIYKTLDGKIVVIHDTDTKRVAEKNLVVAKSTWEELRKLDIAYQFRKKHGLTLEECPKATIPLLEEVLSLVMKQNRSRLSIQPKQDIVDEAIAIIKKMNAEKRVGFNEGSLARVARAKELAPQIPVFYDTNGIDTEQHIAQAKKHGFETIVMYCKNITTEDVDKIHAAGLKAGAWTVNGQEDMSKLLRMGIDRIYTDYPDRLHAAFANSQN